MKPMSLTPIDQKELAKLLATDTYAMFPKLDGRRCLVEITLPDTIVAYARDGIKTNLPLPLIKTFNKIKSYTDHGNIAFDGELMSNGHLYVFDMPRADFGPVHITPQTPFGQRYLILETLCGQVWRRLDADVQLLKDVSRPKDKLILIQKALNRQAEGVVLRHLRGPYVEKRSQWALKWKPRQTIDCIVIDTKWENKANLVLGCYDADGVLVEIGRVSALGGDGKKAKIGDVVEVTCSHQTPEGRLLNPVTPKLRFDKKPHECILGQVAIANLHKVLPEGA